MISEPALLGIAAVALGLVLTPGPNMIYLVSRSITQGRRAGLMSLLGVAAGFGVVPRGRGRGAGRPVRRRPGGLHHPQARRRRVPLYLAWQAVRPGGVSVFAVRELPVDRQRRLFAMGMVTNLLNPKIAVLYVALLPQFVDPDRGSVAAQSLVLGGVQIAIALTVNAVIVLAAGSLAAFLSDRPVWLRTQRYVMGAVLGALAVHLVSDRSAPRSA